jgi:anti-sigma B factor antagonist
MEEKTEDLRMTTHKEGKHVVVKLGMNSLMDPLLLEQLGQRLLHLVEIEDQRRIVLDFSLVQYLSSQAIGIVMRMHQKTAELKGKLVLCGVNAKLTQLMQITKLDKVLKVCPSQKEASYYMENALIG